MPTVIMKMMIVPVTLPVRWLLITEQRLLEYSLLQSPIGDAEHLQRRLIKLEFERLMRGSSEHPLQIESRRSDECADDTHHQLLLCCTRVARVVCALPLLPQRPLPAS
jgi:hypothetical protein